MSLLACFENALRIPGDVLTMSASAYVQIMFSKAPVSCKMGAGWYGERLLFAVVVFLGFLSGFIRILFVSDKNHC